MVLALMGRNIALFCLRMRAGFGNYTRCQYDQISRYILIAERKMARPWTRILYPGKGK